MCSLPISSVSCTNPEVVADYACEIGENPLWHPVEERLYWCDIPKGRLFRFDPTTGVSEPWFAGRPIGGFTIQADGSLLLFMDRGTIAVLRDGNLTEVIREIEAERLSRFNDVIADPRGRVFCGTMSSNASRGRLYRLDLDGAIQLLLEGIGCSNGMAFTLDHRALYHTDSFARAIYLFDYDIDEGRLSNRRVFATFDEADGLPDGITLDAEGRLWVALWDGACIARLHPNGQISDKIVLPTDKVSSLTFAGSNYSEIYITSAGGNTRETNDPLAGALFRLRTKICGRGEFFSRIPARRATF
jgi:D-xylonolactonase